MPLEEFASLLRCTSSLHKANNRQHSPYRGDHNDRPHPQPGRPIAVGGGARTLVTGKAAGGMLELAHYSNQHHCQGYET